MLLQIDFKSGKPVYLQLVDQIRYAAAWFPAAVVQLRIVGGNVSYSSVDSPNLCERKFP